MALRPLFCARGWAGAALTSALVACGGGADEDVAARVGGEPITVRQVADYMRGAGHGSSLEDVEKAVEELIDIHLVALRARDRHDLTSAESLQIAEWGETLLLNQFRDEVIFKEVRVDESKLRQWYQDNVGEEVSSRHILIGVSPAAPDSVKRAARHKADSLLAEIQDGADFAELAEAHSDDEGSARRGGALGYFSRGRMVAPFDSAAFNTTAGEVFPRVVETQFGYHIIKVEDRRKRPFEDLREEIEEQLATPDRLQAEQAYITRLMENSGLEFYEKNVDRLIAIIDSDEGPSGEERNLNLATFQGGTVKLGEIWDLFQLLPEGNRRSIAALDQADMISALSSVVQRKLLLARARTAEMKLDSVRQGQLDERIREFYAQTYLNDALKQRFEVPDSDVRRYYDEHLEFYRGQPFEAVREQIRGILVAQRRGAMDSYEAQRELVAGVADSQAADVAVERYPDHYKNVLPILRGEADATASR